MGEYSTQSANQLFLIFLPKILKAIILEGKTRSLTFPPPPPLIVARKAQSREPGQAYARAFGILRLTGDMAQQPLDSRENQRLPPSPAKRLLQQ